MAEAGDVIERLAVAEALREPVLRAAIAALGLRPGSRGLDAGSGIGLQAQRLAEAVGPTGHVTGVDIGPGLVAEATRRATEAGLAERIAFLTGDMNRLPFADATFDWAWSADCVGYPVGDPDRALAESIRVVRPGGDVVILGWSSQQLLPGHPELEARLNAACSSYLPLLRGEPPERHFLRALGWFRAAGLEEVTARTFVGEVRAPLTSGERAALDALLAMLWSEPCPEVSPADWAEYRRLCGPGSPDAIADEPDYYGFFTYSLFRGTVPGPGYH